MSRTWVKLTSVSLVAVAACASDGRPDQRAVAPPTRIPDPAEAVHGAQAGQPITIAQVPVEVRRAVVADAARRFKVAESAVVLERAEQVTWSDGSLGCPVAGRTYTQMLVEGYKVVARTTSAELVYHTDQRGNVVTCGAMPMLQRPSGTAPKDALPRTGPASQSPDQ